MHAHRGTGVTRADRARELELFRDVATGEHDTISLSVAFDFGLEPPRQRVGHGDADTMQATRECVSALSRPLVELASCVQPREHELDRRHLFLGMRADRNAAAIVLDAD